MVFIRMKAKLTITVNRELLPAAKRYARARGVSLSSIVESTLRDLSKAPREPFSRRWRGKFKSTERKDERYAALAKKYL